MNPKLSPGLYAIRHKSLELFFKASPLADRPDHFTQRIDEAKLWSAGYLNETVWSWSVWNDAVSAQATSSTRISTP